MQKLGNTPPTSTKTISLIQACLRSRWQPDALQEAERIASLPDFDWPEFLGFALENDLAPLIYYLVYGQAWLPTWASQRLHKLYLDSATKNAILFQELEQILRAFGKLGQKLIILKGSALGTQIYPNLALRPMVDLDLLVDRSKTTPAISILQQLGFQIARVEEQQGFTINYENEIVLRKYRAIDIVVEVHWSLFNSPYYQYKLSQEWLWESAKTIDLNGATALMLKPEIQVLHLCGHLSYHHAGEGWLWRHDLAEMVMHYREGLDWDQIIEYAGRFELLITLQTNITSLQAIYGSIVPDEVFKKLTAYDPTKAEKRLFSQLNVVKKKSGQTFLEDISSLPNLQSKLDFALHNIFPSPRYMKARYQFKASLLLPYFYAYRWFLGIKSLF